MIRATHLLALAPIRGLIAVACLSSGCSGTAVYTFDGVTSLDIEVDWADIEVIGDDAATETLVEVRTSSALGNPGDITAAMSGQSLSITEACDGGEELCRNSVTITVPRESIDEVEALTWSCLAVTVTHLDAYVEVLGANGPDCVITLDDLSGDVFIGGDADKVASDLSGDNIIIVGGGSIDLGLTGTPTFVDLFGPDGVDVTLPAGAYDLDISFDKSPTLVNVTHDPTPRSTSRHPPRA